MDERQPTVREIARRSGFGKSTVSLALRDDHRLPLQTRQRIQAVAQKLGYRPNPYVSSLMTHWRRTRTMKAGATLGLLSLRHDTLIPPPGSILARYLEGINGRAQELGYSVDELWLRAPGMTPRRMNGILRSRQIRAVIVIPLPEDQGVVDLDWSPLAAATMGYSVSNLGMPRACFNNVQGVTVLLERMHELGYRRVGLAMKHSHDERTNHLWLAGYLAFQHLRVAERNRLSPLLVDDWREDGCLPTRKCRKCLANWA
jgi:DNA-binding LacI/PurR family transcriptional regulator